MLNPKARDKLLFAFLFVGGLALCFWGPLWIRDKTCSSPAENSISVKNDNAAAGQHEKKTDGFAKSENTSANNGDNKSQNWETLHFLFCGDIKLTDLALVFFTYGLFVVAWMTVRGADRNTEATERSYVVPGYDDTAFNGYAVISLVMTNCGRMPGVVKEVGYAFLKRDLPRWRWQADWAWTTISYDWVIRPEVRRPIDTLRGLPDERVFVMYIKYEDLFTRRIHYSRMGMAFKADGKIDRAGGNTWNGWT